MMVLRPLVLLFLLGTVLAQVPCCESGSTDLPPPFATFNFTSVGVSGVVGPTYAQTQASSGYGNASSQWFNDPRYFAVVGGIQYVTIWTSGNYTFTAAGAGGASAFGAVVSGGVTLQAGNIVALLVGQQTLQTDPSNNGFKSGSGGSFVALVSAAGNVSGATPLFVAGGAGGIGAVQNAFVNATLTTSGNPGGSGLAGGTGGNGGTNGVGEGGGGFETSGGNALAGTPLVGASFLFGGIGGGGIAPIGAGFGGGGGYGGHALAGGGGGGYSGGGGGQVVSANGTVIAGGGSGGGFGTGGGGAGSYGAAPFLSASVSNAGGGYITMTRSPPSPPPPSPPPPPPPLAPFTSFVFTSCASGFDPGRPILDGYTDCQSEYLGRAGVSPSGPAAAALWFTSPSLFAVVLSIQYMTIYTPVRDACTVVLRMFSC